MKRSFIIMLVASAMLIAGIFVAGCTSDSGSSASSTAVTSPQAVQSLTVSEQAAAGTQEKPVPSGTIPEGMQMNGTAPSGTPPEGMVMNGTAPSGGPGGMPGNGTAPSGEKPSGTPPSGTPPSGTPATGA
jgi:hypothetical protein